MPYFFSGCIVVDRRARWQPRLTDATKTLNTCPNSDHAPARLVPLPVNDRMPGSFQSSLRPPTTRPLQWPPPGAGLITC